MNEEPKSVWKKSFTGWGWLWAWLILVVATFFIVLIIGLFLGGSQNSGAALGISAAVSVAASVFVGFLAFIHWLRSWRNFRRFLFAIACLITLIALAYAEEDWRSWHAWNQFKRQWEAKGETFDRQSVIPVPVPNDDNFAMAPIWVELLTAHYGTNLAEGYYGKTLVQREQAKLTSRLQMTIGDWNEANNWPAIGNWEKATITELNLWQDYYRALAAKTNEFEFPTAPQPKSPAQDVLLALSKYNSTIKALREAARRPYARFPVEYDAEDPARIPLAHLNVVRMCSQVLQLRAIAELQGGQNEQALADVKLALRLANSIRNELFLVSHLVRIAMLRMTLQPIYEGLAENKWSDAQLAELDSELAKLNFAISYKLALRGEMVFCHDGTFDYLRRHPEQIYNLSGNYGNERPSLLARILTHLIPSGWFYQYELNCTRPMVKYYLPEADAKRDTFSPSKAKEAEVAVASETKRLNGFNGIEKLMLPSLSGAAEQFAYGQTAVDLARTAIALERYRLAHGGYPDSLDALAPQLMEKIPHDVIGGGPLHYRLTSDGEFVLYSIGWNERDDGGVVGLTKTRTVDIDKGDWVWRYPQK
jgi:hypothetical protein